MRLFLLLCFAGVFLQGNAKPLKEGTYRAVLELNRAANAELPFNFTLKYRHRKPQITIYNAEEQINVTEVSVKGDSVFLRMPVFDTEIRAQITGGEWKGMFVNHYRQNERIIPFRAVFGETRRFIYNDKRGEAFTSEPWECTFSPGSPQASKAKGIFKNLEQTMELHGTFLTETGDYRFLEGMQSGDSIFLSCFDGSHAFLFQAQRRGDSLVNGMFYSGMHWQEPWVARKNPGFNLRDADSITVVKDPAAVIGFKFLNTEGVPVSLSDPRYRNKAVILQLMGSWCPNCMDESRYLSKVYEKYNPQGLEIIALAFEKVSDEKKAMAQVSRMKKNLAVPYEVLLTNAVGKDAAGKTLPMLNGITAFPTTLFLDKEHKVRRIHTGFSGPATGAEFTHFSESTENLILQLLK